MENKKSFCFLGIHFTPLRKFRKGWESDFFELSHTLSYVKDLTPKGWSHTEFYKVAESHNMATDIYEINFNGINYAVVAAGQYLFKFHPQKRFQFICKKKQQNFKRSSK